jgi:hypothetical protein
MPKIVNDDTRLSVRLNYRDTEQGGTMLRELSEARGTSDTATLRQLVREEHRRHTQRTRNAAPKETQEG